MKPLKYTILNTISLAAIMSILSACSQFDPEPPAETSSFVQGTLPSIGIIEGTGSVTSSTATVNVIVKKTGGRKITRFALCYSTTSNPTINHQVVELGEVNAGDENIIRTANLTNLTHNTTYHVRAYAVNSEGEVYSSELHFTTPIDKKLPLVTTEGYDKLTETTVSLYATISSLGEGQTQVTQHGHVWATHNNPTLTDNKTTNGNSSGGEYLSEITNLTESTSYYFRAYATNGHGISYGEIRSFSTKGKPQVSTTNITEITYTTAMGGGTVMSNGGYALTARGVVWSTSPNPTIAENQGITNNGTFVGAYASGLTNLTQGTKYYVRAYATNSQGTNYGEQKEFTTLSGNLATVSTATITNITATTATSGGTITADGGKPVTARGVCWSTTQNPTIANSKTTDGSGIGAFTSHLTNLNGSTTYYVRSYATTEIGTSYGEQQTFTSSPPSIPTLTTAVISQILSNGATSGGEIINTGGADVTARGVCWSTNQNPTISDKKTSNGSGFGAFTSKLTGLVGNTTYYVRSYATNSQGTGYGQQRSFTTATPETVMDSDGNVYLVVTIGTQKWMAENLRTTKYNDGTAIGTNYTNEQWANLTTGAFAIYPNSSISGLNSESEVLEAYGALYNWYAIETSKLCPTGWHVPTDAEWSTLVSYAGGKYVAGGKLKSIRTAPDSHPRWEGINRGATDEFGFSGLPGGLRLNNGGYINILWKGKWWSSTNKEGDISAYAYEVSSLYHDTEKTYDYKESGFSVRCIKD